MTRAQDTGPRTATPVHSAGNPEEDPSRCGPSFSAEAPRKCVERLHCDRCLQPAPGEAPPSAPPTAVSRAAAGFPLLGTSHPSLTQASRKALHPANPGLHPVAQGRKLRVGGFADLFDTGGGGELTRQEPIWSPASWELVSSRSGAFQWVILLLGFPAVQR